MQRTLKLISCFVPPLRRMREKGALGNQMEEQSAQAGGIRYPPALERKCAADAPYARLRLRVKERICAFSCESGCQDAYGACASGWRHKWIGWYDWVGVMCGAETRLLKKVHGCSNGCERDLRCIVELMCVSSPHAGFKHVQSEVRPSVSQHY